MSCLAGFRKVTALLGYEPEPFQEPDRRRGALRASDHHPPDA